MENLQVNIGGYRHLKEFLDRQENILSIIDVDNTELCLTPEYFESKVHTKFQHAIFKDSKLNTIEILFETNSNFYIYLFKNDILDNYYNVKILFHNSKKDEVMFLLRSFNKKIK
jgi:hypothetical protein